MQKIYTKKQILEALQWWKAQLKLVSESKENVDDFDTQVQSDELDDGSYEESLKLMSREEVDSKADAELKKQASALGLANGAYTRYFPSGSDSFNSHLEYSQFSPSKMCNLAVSNCISDTSSA